MKPLTQVAMEISMPLATTPRKPHAPINRDIALAIMQDVANGMACYAILAKHGRSSSVFATSIGIPYGKAVKMVRAGMTAEQILQHSPRFAQQTQELPPPVGDHLSGILRLLSEKCGDEAWCVEALGLLARIPDGGES